MSDLADALLAGLNCWLLLLNHSTDNNQVEIGNNSKQVLMNDRLADRREDHGVRWNANYLPT